MHAVGMTTQRFMPLHRRYGATGLILHEEPNAILLEVLLFESLERHCCSSPYGFVAFGLSADAVGRTS